VAKWEKRTGYFMLALALFVSVTGIATSILTTSSTARRRSKQSLLRRRVLYRLQAPLEAEEACDILKAREDLLQGE